MDLARFTQHSEYKWEIAPQGAMRVPAIIYASEALVREMDDKVYEQAVHVAALPGIQKASFAMPDAHWGYGFPIGGVAAFDPEEGGVVSAGGVGFDISCGVRTLLTGMPRSEIEPRKKELADLLYKKIPAGVGSTSLVHLDADEMDAMLRGGAQWAVERGYGTAADLERIEEHGCMAGAEPEHVSAHAKHRQEDEMGTLGSGNHYLEVQEITGINDSHAAEIYGLHEGDIVISIHCGSRGLGHQIGTDYLKSMLPAAARFGIELPDRELACAPITSDAGRAYLGAMRAGINCALGNRQILTHTTRKAWDQVFPHSHLTLLYDVSHNTCKLEEHALDGHRKRLFVHRKGATRALGPSHPDLPADFREVGQPVLIGGSMGTCSYILAGTTESEQCAFSSAVHGAGRAMSRHQATRTWKGRQVVDELAARGILIRSPSSRGVAEEAPGAYKNVSAVVDAADHAHLARKVAKLDPVICVKG